MSIKIRILDEFQQQYGSLIEYGRTIASTKSICITGLARDIEPKINYVLPTLTNLASVFKECYFVLYENDSKDSTPKLLADWSNSTKNIHIISEIINSTHPVGPSSKSKSRTSALASYRNKCQTYISENIPDTDYIMAIDLDFLFYSLEGLFNSIAWISSSGNKINGMAGISYMSQNKNLVNYDSWAFRHTWWSDQQSNMPWFGFWYPFAGSSPFKVNSAFGGSVIYERQMFLSAQYEGYDCEHVCFHKNISTHNKYNLYINPSQIMIL